MYNMNNITIERLEQIEKERIQTMITPEYQEWCKQLNVSRSAIDINAMNQTRQMIEDYNYSNYKFKFAV